MLTKADSYFLTNLLAILKHGTWDENPRPKYQSDGSPAHSKFITQVFEKYDIGSGEFPISELRPIPVMSGIKEIQWIYQDQTSELDVLEEKYGIMWWRPWDVGDGTIGRRYGETVRVHNLMNKFLDGLVEDPFGRRHIISLWQEEDFDISLGLNPCAFLVIGTVRQVKGVKYFDLSLIQRSSDYVVAGHINKMQYVAFMMMVAKHCGYEAGVFSHFVQNLHIYDRHIEQVEELLHRADVAKDIFPDPSDPPQLLLNVPNGTSFYDISHEDFKLVNYNPMKPQLKFDLGV
jgi:thymidylate synthase